MTSTVEPVSTEAIKTLFRCPAGLPNICNLEAVSGSGLAVWG